MNRNVAIIAAALAVAIAAGFYFLVWQPKQAEIAELDEQREAVLAEQNQLRARIAELEEIRASAPEIEAAVVAAESIVPRDLALPSALRQLQLAADESGIELVTVSPTRPEQVTGAEPGVSRIDLTLQTTGGYYQLVDFLRRVEDPSITPRGFVWGSLSIAPAEHPTLSASVTGAMFTVLPQPPAEEQPQEQGEPEGESDEDAPAGDAGTASPPSDGAGT